MFFLKLESKNRIFLPYRSVFNTIVLNKILLLTLCRKPGERAYAGALPYMAEPGLKVGRHTRFVIKNMYICNSWKTKNKKQL